MHGDQDPIGIPDPAALRILTDARDLIAESGTTYCITTAVCRLTRRPVLFPALDLFVRAAGIRCDPRTSFFPIWSWWDNATPDERDAAFKRAGVPGAIE